MKNFDPIAKWEDEVAANYMQTTTIAKAQKKLPKAVISFEIRLDEAATADDSRAAYEDIYGLDDISQSNSFYLWIQDLLALKPGETYLDISCGRAQLTTLARQHGAQAHGLDLSYTALQSGWNAGQGGDLITGNSQELPYAPDSFDVISNIGSLEHYLDMQTAVQQMARVLKPGGRAVVLVPNSFSLLHNIWIAARDGRTNIDQQPIQRYAARVEWQALLEENGLVVVDTIKYEIETPRTMGDWARYLQHPKKMLRLALRPFVPLNLAFCFVYLCHKQ
ncbi:MAG: methyltransferase domain-containing protein [Anaerolineales bacterium]|nr:methyltransferase domain-containing protein [Anaerolineales bacterium]